MNKEIFISESFTNSINQYLRCKNKPDGIEFNSFLVVLVRILVIIYDELDIVNPFYLNKEEVLYRNLQKYGYPRNSIVSFFNMFNKFDENPSEKVFIELQKSVVDMFSKKKKAIKVSSGEIEKIKGLLFSPDACNSLIVSYNFMMTKNPYEVMNYFITKISEEENEVKSVRKKEFLNLEAYEILRYSLDEIEKMSVDELDAVNKKVYNFFNINVNAINKEYLLNKAVYNYSHPKSAFSTGNGYVDILFYLAITATIGFVIFILTIIF